MYFYVGVNLYTSLYNTTKLNINELNINILNIHTN